MNHRAVYLGGDEPIDCDLARWVAAAVIAFWLCVWWIS